jgi:hypothetical protein
MVRQSECFRSVLIDLWWQCRRKRVLLSDHFLATLGASYLPELIEAAALQGRPEERHAVHVEEEPAHVSLPG